MLAEVSQPSLIIFIMLMSVALYPNAMKCFYMLCGMVPRYKSCDVILIPCENVIGYRFRKKKKKKSHSWLILGDSIS